MKNFEIFKDFTFSRMLRRIKKIKKKTPRTDDMSFAHYKLANMEKYNLPNHILALLSGLEWTHPLFI
uniref:Uncharacterized protein n=1 Tax=Strongyloides venezuelensis TaxID=75913 RepID=A0A0K0F045_STRVS